MSEQENNGPRRNNNNRNRNNNNRSNNNRSGNRNNNRNNNNRSNSRPSHRAPRPLKLSGWQKFLKVIGLFNEEKARKQQDAAYKAKKSNATKSTDSTPARSNTRVAKERKPHQPVAVETARLYVGNLSYDASDHDIEELFKGIGSVKKVEIIYNRHTHKSRGYGFVQMLNTEEAKRAVEVLHDQPFLGRNLIVNGSKARKESDRSGDNADENFSDDAE